MQVFKEARNRYTQAVRVAKARYFKLKFASCSANSKNFWDTVKTMENKNTSSQLPMSLKLGNNITTNKFMIIENFNKHFAEAGHAFHLAAGPPANCSTTPAATQPHPPLHPLLSVEGVAKSGPLQINLDPNFLK